MISYDYYRIFYFVARYGSFTRAATMLMSNQPNVTRAIKKLEEELGCRLLMRSNKGVSLTQEGERLYERVAVAFEQLKAGEEELALDRTLKKGVISIGVTETALHRVLIPVLQSYRRMYPGIKMRIFNYSTPQAVASVKNNLVDFAIATTPTGSEGTLKEIMLSEFGEVFVAGRQYEDMAQKQFELSELHNYPMVAMARNTMTYAFYSSLFADNAAEYSPDMEAATIDQVLTMIKQNLGIGFLPEPIARPEIDAGNLIELKLKESIMKRNICLIKKRKHSLCIAAEVFEKMILENAKERGCCTK